MVISLLLLASLGVLLTSFPNVHDDEDQDMEDEAIQEFGDSDNPQNEISGLDVLHENEYIGPIDLLVSEANIQGELNSSVDTANEDFFEEVDTGTYEIPDLPAESLNVFTLNLTSSSISDSIAPLDDFNSNPNTPVLDVGGFDYIDVDLPQNRGSVGILRADYLERSENEGGDELESLHTGVNFYFIPSGESFPEDYVWSMDGSSLYDEQSYLNDGKDFGGIRLILRVDTGFLHDVPSHASGMNFSDEKFDRLDGLIVGNEIIYLS